MGKKLENVKVNEKKFDECLKKKGLNKSKLSKELGRSPNYLNQYMCDNDNAIPVYVANMLQKFYDVKYEEYKFEEPKKVEETKVVKEVSVNDLKYALKQVLKEYDMTEQIGNGIVYILNEEKPRNMLKLLIKEVLSEELEKALSL